MIVCVCEAVSDRQIEAVIASGCRTVAQVGARCGAGTDCGQCVRDLRRRLQDVRQRRDDPPAVAAK